MAASSKITADFTTDTSGMRSGIAKITGMFNKLTKTSTNTQKALSRMTSGINFLVFDKLGQYALAAGRAFKNMVSGSINAIDAVDKLAKSTGISAQGLQVFGLAAEKAGVDQTALSGAFGRMSKRLAEATQGFGEALPALERLGLSAEELTQLTPEEQFLKIGAAIGGLATQGEQAAAAFKIFSDQGLRLVPLFADINAQTEAAREELDRFGGILSDQQIAGTVALKDNLTDVSQIFRNIVNQVTANLAPAINAVVESFKEFVSAQGGANIGKSISDGIFNALIAAGKFVDQVVVSFAGVAEMFGITGTLWENVAFALDVAFNLAWRVGKFLEGVFYTAQSNYNSFLEGLASVAEKLVSILNRTGLFDLDGVEEGLAAFRQGMQQETLNSIESAENAFADAFGSGAQAAQEAVSGGWEELFKNLKNNMPSITVPDQQDLPKLELSEQSKQSIKLSGLDARSSAGMNFLLQSGVVGKKPEEETAKNTRQIAQNTAKPGINVIQMGIA